MMASPSTLQRSRPALIRAPERRGRLAVGSDRPSVEIGSPPRHSTSDNRWAGVQHALLRPHHRRRGQLPSRFATRLAATHRLLRARRRCAYSRIGPRYRRREKRIGADRSEHSLHRRSGRMRVSRRTAGCRFLRPAQMHHDGGTSHRPSRASPASTSQVTWRRWRRSHRLGDVGAGRAGRWPGGARRRGEAAACGVPRRRRSRCCDAGLRGRATRPQLTHARRGGTIGFASTRRNKPSRRNASPQPPPRGRSTTARPPPDERPAERSIASHRQGASRMTSAASDSGTLTIRDRGSMRSRRGADLRRRRRAYAAGRATRGRSRQRHLAARPDTNSESRHPGAATSKLAVAARQLQPRSYRQPGITRGRRAGERGDRATAGARQKVQRDRIVVMDVARGKVGPRLRAPQAHRASKGEPTAPARVAALASTRARHQGDACR